MHKAHRQVLAPLCMCAFMKVLSLECLGHNRPANRHWKQAGSTLGSAFWRVDTLPITTKWNSRLPIFQKPVGCSFQCLGWLGFFPFDQYLSLPDQSQIFRFHWPFDPQCQEGPFLGEILLVRSKVHGLKTYWGHIWVTSRCRKDNTEALFI